MYPDAPQISLTQPRLANAQARKKGEENRSENLFPYLPTDDQHTFINHIIAKRNSDHAISDLNNN